MKPDAYYNENDEEKAEWLRELIRTGVIAAGEVDTRSISKVWPEDLDGFSQCHFFAGIGVWSYALRLAGWSDDRPVWTGSCPCPSFSAAGKGAGFDDPRHLWPDWARLIRKRRPATIFGEQADDAIGYGWLDLVQTDLEREDYAVGKAVLGACSVGAPHIRQRLYFVAHSAIGGIGAFDGESVTGIGRKEPTGRCGSRDGLAHAESERCGKARGSGARPEERPSDTRESGGMGNARHNGRTAWKARPEHESRPPIIERLASASQSDMGESVSAGLEGHDGHGANGRQSRWFGAQPDRSTAAPGHVNGFWRDADWVLRKRWNSDDWEWCPTEPGTFPLVAGAPARVLRLRGYGDSICAEVAKAFIEASVK